MKYITLLVFALALSGCSKNADWVGFYYPDKDNIGDSSKWVIMPGFETLDQCRLWVADISNGKSNYDYECGKKCRREDSGLMICKETVK
jgi:hypothetical protein